MLFKFLKKNLKIEFTDTHTRNEKPGYFLSWKSVLILPAEDLALVIRYFPLSTGWLSNLFFHNIVDFVPNSEFYCIFLVTDNL